MGVAKIVKKGLKAAEKFYDKAKEEAQDGRKEVKNFIKQLNENKKLKPAGDSSTNEPTDTNQAALLAEQKMYESMKDCFGTLGKANIELCASKTGEPITVNSEKFEPRKIVTCLLELNDHGIVPCSEYMQEIYESMKDCFGTLGEANIKLCASKTGEPITVNPESFEPQKIVTCLLELNDHGIVPCSELVSPEHTDL